MPLGVLNILFNTEAEIIQQTETRQRCNAEAFQPDFFPGFKLYFFTTEFLNTLIHGPTVLKFNSNKGWREIPQDDINKINE